METTSEKKPAVFLDRDGTIIEQVELPQRESDLKLISGAAQAIARFNEAGFFVVIISNQPVVARGLITLDEAYRLNTEFLAGELQKEGARIDAVYLCPHHPQANMVEYRMVCDCRKPGDGMIQNAVRDHNIDLSRSFLIGDSTQDVGAGKKAGVTTILVKTGHGGKDVWQHEGEPDFVAEDLAAAADYVLEYKK